MTLDEASKNPDGTYDGAKTLSWLSEALGYKIPEAEIKEMFDVIKRKKESASGNQESRNRDTNPEQTDENRREAEKETSAGSPESAQKGRAEAMGSRVRKDRAVVITRTKRQINSVPLPDFNSGVL